MMTISNFFDNLYRNTTNEDEFDKVCDYERAVYNLYLNDDNEFENFLQEHNLEYNIEWAWDNEDE